MCKDHAHEVEYVKLPTSATTPPPQATPEQLTCECGCNDFEDTGSFMVQILRCKNCSKEVCEDSGDAFII